jgi:fucose 4-O-acetylase-like acetyltransferase
MCAVVALHVLSLALPRFDSRGTGWLAAAGLDAFLMFAVPLFLVISTILFMESAARDGDPFRTAVRRIRTYIGPYLLWSVIFLAIAWGRHDETDLCSAAVRILTGKSYYHLYFLGVLIQLFVIVPCLAPAVRRIGSFGQACGFAACAALAVYWLNRSLLHMPYVGSTVVWYFPAIVPAIWLGRRRDLTRSILPRYLPWLAAFTACAAAAYLPLVSRTLRGLPVDTFAFQVAEWSFTTGAAFTILASAFRVAPSPGGPLGSIGHKTMPIYILHRFPIMLLMSGSAGANFPVLILMPLAAAAGLALPLAADLIYRRVTPRLAPAHDSGAGRRPAERRTGPPFAIRCANYRGEVVDASDPTDPTDPSDRTYQMAPSK